MFRRISKALWRRRRKVGGFAYDGLKALFRRLTRSSIFIDVDELYMCSLEHPKKLSRTLELYSPGSVLDLGCGTGRSLDFFLARGIDVVGVEGSSLAIRHARHPERIRRHDLNHPLDLGRTFDLVWCLEVVEHIHPSYLEVFMPTITRHSDVIVLSAARPGQGGEGHFNEQPPEYWIAVFARFGFAEDREATAALRAVDEVFAENMLAFRRSANAGADR
jgi:SAM-dependent methyltransferase